MKKQKANRQREAASSTPAESLRAVEPYREAEVYGQPTLHVSVVIPAHNAAETIAETLRSLQAQTRDSWEAIVVDDGSTDSTAAIVQGFADRDERIRLLRIRQAGEAGARNAALDVSRHDWVLFLDADDWIASTHLARLTAELARNPALDAVHCGSARVTRDGTLTVERYEPPEGDLFPVLARRAAFPVHACLVRRSLVEAVGRFDTSLRKSADWDLWQRIARTGAQFGAVREVLAFYRMRPNAASLEAVPLFEDGMRVLKQGHSPDPRVSNPDPQHASGEAPELVRTQEFYLLCWCAGLMLGSGQDPRRLFELVPGDDYPELDAEAVARCIFESAPLPSSQPPAAWEKLWPRLELGIKDLFAALERQTGAPDLGRSGIHELKRLILRNAPTWRPVFDEFEEAAKREAAEGNSLRHRAAALEEQLARAAREAVLAEDLRQRAAALEEQLAHAAREAVLAEDLRRRVAALEEQLAHADRRRDLLQEEKAREGGRAAQLQQEVLRQQGLLGSFQERLRSLEEQRWMELASKLESAIEGQRASFDALALEMRNLERSFWWRVGRRLGFIGVTTRESD